MSENLIEKTMRMKKWAIVGASDHPNRTSNEIQRILMRRGYTVYPVSPRLEEVEGLVCYPSVASLPDRPDVVDMVVNPSIGLEVMKEIEAAGIRYVWLQPGSRNEAIREFSRAHGIDVVEDCIMAQLRLRPDFRAEA